MDEEELQDEELNEEMDEDEENEESEEQEAEEQAEAEAEEEAMLQEQEKKAKIKELKPKLAEISSTLTSTGAVSLTMKGKEVMKEARKYKELAAQIALIYSIIAFNKIKRAIKKAMQWVTRIASSGPAGFWAILIGFILIVAICVIASLFMIFSSADGGSSSPFGITGKDFYGARMVYKDDTLATKNIIEDYVEFVEDGINATTAITTATKEGVDFDVEITVNLAMPSADYDYSQFNEEEFKTNYPQLHALVFDIAKIVYKQDNNADTTATTLVECVDGILYFGYGRTVIADISKLVGDEIIANTTFASDDTEGKLTKTDIDALIQTELTDLYDNEKYEIRTEKLFIKDYILNSADEKLSGITEENYVAMLFMPKINVEFEKFSFAMGGKDLSDLQIKLTNNGNEIVLNKDEYDYSTDDGETQRNIYISNKNLNVEASSFTAIETNTELFKQGCGLFDIMGVVENYFNYLELSAGQTDVYTFNQSGVVLSVSCSQPIVVVDYETVWSAN